MTREEAKNVLRLYNNQKFGIVSPEFWEAIAVAIAALQSDPDAPDWSQAPEWARWYTIDKNKTECWFENEPLWIGGVHFASSGKMDYCSEQLVQSLFKRPYQ